MPLTITECDYPNPAMKYGAFKIGAKLIGTADKVEGGWKLPHGRKVLTAEMAAKAMLDRKISAARKDETEARKLLEALRMYCGGRLPHNASLSRGEAVGLKR